MRWSINSRNFKTTEQVLDDYVVSLTSYRGRIDWVYIPISSILLGSLKPNVVVLYLSREEFPGELSDLPKELIRLQSHGLTIEFVDGNLRSHKKYRYAFEAFPNKKIITIDDDIIYPFDFLQRVFTLNEGLPEKSTVSCLGMRMQKGEGELGFMPYRHWEYVFNTDQGEDLLLMGGYGCLYNSPSSMIHYFDEMEAMNLFATGDDIYLYYLGRKAGLTNYVFGAEYSRIFPVIPWVQNTNLFEVNIGEGKNDEMLRNMQRLLS
ncbi:MAG: hypothetical protein RLZZ252_30 [Bacteroidota bacterium]